MKKIVRITLQIVGLCVYYWILEKIIALLQIPIPASVLGMVLLAVLLITDLIPLRMVEEGAQVLIKILPIMFVPDGVALIYSFGIIKENGIWLLLIFFITTILVMGLTAITSIALQRGKKPIKHEVEGRM